MPTWTVLEMFKKGRVEEYKQFVRRRQKNANIADSFWNSYQSYLKLRKQYDEYRHKLNVLSEKLSMERNDKLKEEAKQLKGYIADLEEKMKQREREYKELSLKLPNIILPNVPDGKSEADNVPIEYWGKPKVWKKDVEKFKELTGGKADYKEVDFRPLGHAELLEDKLKLCDSIHAGKIASSRFYYLFEDIVWLDFALSLFMMDFLTKKGYKLVLPPYMIRESVLQAALDYETFKDMIYKVENTELCLIGTAEHPLLALYIGRQLTEQELPLKLVGWSACFRKEAGAHGKETKGIFRVHQFHKVEQLIFAPRDVELSEKLFDEMVENTKQALQKLDIPYRVVNMCTAELADHAARKYDIEAWFPAQCSYKELASISNCLDWQAYRGNIVYRLKDTGKLEYAYTLNGTGIATSRTICAIVENYQQEDGSISIPKVLQEYLEPFEKAPKEVILPYKKRI